jgi:TRAP-type C4-dicarboxylate transport system permease small subunit
MKDRKVENLAKLNVIADKINSIARNVVLAGIIIMTPVVFLNVVVRYLFRVSLPWSPEVARYSFVWITFIGTAVALREKSHAKIDLLVERAPKSTGKYLKLANYCIMIGLSVLLIIAGVKQMIDVWPTKAAYMRFLSMGWMYLTIPVCGVLMLFFSCVSIWELFLDENLPHTEEPPPEAKERMD